MRLLFGVLLVASASPVAAAVPIKVAPSGHVTVPVRGSFGIRQFVFDTGAETSAVYAGFADQAGLKAAGSVELQGQTGTADVSLVRLEKLTLDGTSKAPIDAVRLEPRADGAPLNGIVGLDVFGDRTVDFDLPAKRLSILAPGKRAKRLSSTPVDAKPISGGLLTFPVRIRSVTATAVIDTGARKTRMNWKLGHMLGLDPTKLEKGDTVRGATNRAVEMSATQIEDVHLGSRVLATAPVQVADLPVFEAFGVNGGPAVILGLDWLEKTRMVIDFAANKVWFQAAGRSR